MFAVFKALKKPRYLVLAVIAGLLIMWLYPFLQILPQGLNNFWYWFTLLTPLTWFLYFLYGILFGMTVSFSIWRARQRVCPPSKISGAGFFGLLGGLLGGAVPLCAACLSFPALFLPVSVFLFLAKYSLAIMILSVGLLLFALWFLGGFQNLKPET